MTINTGYTSDCYRVADHLTQVTINTGYTSDCYRVADHLTSDCYRVADHLTQVTINTGYTVTSFKFQVIYQLKETLKGYILAIIETPFHFRVKANCSIIIAKGKSLLV